MLKCATRCTFAIPPARAGSRQVKMRVFTTCFLIGAADTVRLIEGRAESVSTNGGQVPPPVNERQIRPLLKLSTPERSRPSPR